MFVLEIDSFAIVGIAFAILGILIFLTTRTTILAMFRGSTDESDEGIVVLACVLAIAFICGGGYITSGSIQIL